MVYLFIGQDSFYKDTPFSCKDIQLKHIKEEFLPKEVEEFNFDILYAETLKLKDLQEKLLALPVKSPQRIVVVRNAQELTSDLEDFIVEWVKQPPKETLLLLDIEGQDKKEAFIKNIYKYVKVLRFKETLPLNTFNLSRQIEQRRPDYALKVLSQLLKDGERPERILGGLRYALENSRLQAPQIRNRIRFLLQCDIEIKTGKIKPVFALEKLVVKLCALVQPFH